MILNLKRFIEQEQAYWDELESILHDRKQGIKFNAQRLKRFSYLYERASGDLVKLSAFSGEKELRIYLESLVARSYSEIHSVNNRKLSFRPFYWLYAVFPGTFRRNFNAFLLTLIVFMAGAMLGGIVIMTESSAKEAIFPMQFRHLHQSPDKRVESEEQDSNARSSTVQGTAPAFAAHLMVNNIKVSILALALGMTFGIGTVLVMFYNGVILGAVVTDFILAGHTSFVAGWLLPHGSFEIPAVLIAGQAGFILAGCLLKPSGHRREALREKGADLMTLVGGVALMLIWAGIVEAFLSQYHEPYISYGLKISFGIVQLLVLFAWLALGGCSFRRNKREFNNHE